MPPSTSKRPGARATTIGSPAAKSAWRLARSQKSSASGHGLAETTRRWSARGIATRAVAGVSAVSGGGSRGEVEHAADSILRFHQVEALVDLVQSQPMRNERVDIDVPG